MPSAGVSVEQNQESPRATPSPVTADTEAVGTASRPIGGTPTPTEDLPRTAPVAQGAFVTFDSTRKCLARIVAVTGRTVTIRRYAKKTGEWQTKNESREREACIPLTAAEAEESFPGCVAAWEGAKLPVTGGAGATTIKEDNRNAVRRPATDLKIQRDLRPTIGIHPKADKMSASNPTRAFDPRTDLTVEETKVVRKFVEKGKALDKPAREFLALAVEVKAIFAKKVRGIPVLFEGRYYLTFEKLVEKKFPRSSRTIRRWLAEAGKTDQRFANKRKPKPPKAGSASDPGTASVNSKLEPEVAPETAIAKMKDGRDARIRSAVGYPRGKMLPTNYITVYEAGWRQGYANALANATKRKAVA